MSESFENQGMRDAEQMYNHFCCHVLDHSGEPQPRWEKLPREMKWAWIAMAEHYMENPNDGWEG